MLGTADELKGQVYKKGEHCDQESRGIWSNIDDARTPECRGDGRSAIEARQTSPLIHAEDLAAPTPQATIVSSRPHCAPSRSRGMDAVRHIEYEAVLSNNAVN